jgi:hypothetical protein
MAIYHLSVKSGRQYGSSGSRGASHYAYINREGKYKREDLENIKSGNLPNWAKDAAHFWKSADKNERINGRIYTELEISLPRELNKEQREDKGIITGVLLKALESYKSNPQHFDSLKIAGDKFIADREQSKKSKSTLVDNSGSTN